ncbi:356_t:CDS:2 [Funneliformis geosporum]|nr:356_t:CDS:2 [Funneliformis geosporum]
MEYAADGSLLRNYLKENFDNLTWGEGIVHRDLIASGNILIRQGVIKLADCVMEVYSAGVLLWELSSGRPPFYDKGEDYDIV